MFAERIEVVEREKGDKAGAMFAERMKVVGREKGDKADAGCRQGRNRMLGSVAVLWSVCPV